MRDDCWLIKDGRSIAISKGDPHNEYVGKTEPIPDGMRLRYRLVRRTVERKDEKLPGDWISDGSSRRTVSGLIAIGSRHSFFRRVVPSNADEYQARYDALLRQYF